MTKTQKQKTFTAELPWNLSEEHIQLLRTLGGVTFTFDIDATQSRAKTVAELGDEFGWIGLDRGRWDENLSGRRHRPVSRN